MRRIEISGPVKELPMDCRCSLSVVVVGGVGGVGGVGSSLCGDETMDCSRALLLLI